MDAKTIRAAENIRMELACPGWYQHMNNVEAAMRHHDDVCQARRDYGWECDDLGWTGPDPLNPGEHIHESLWEDQTGLPFPEDMKPDDELVLNIMEILGQHADPYSACHEIAEMVIKRPNWRPLNP